MTPPSLEVAREILADTAAKARASGDPINEIAAAAIDVALARLARLEAIGRAAITAIAEPAPGAPRMLCGLPVDGGSCRLPYGHGGHTQDGGCSRWGG